MAESSARIVLRGDGKELILTAKKAKDAVTDIGKAAGGVGGQFSKMGGELLKTVGRAFALKQALQGALNTAKEFAEVSKKAGESAGKSVLDRDLAAGKLGLSALEAEGITGQAGPRSREELTGFLGSLASGDNAKFLDKRGVFRAATAFGSGVFSESEVLSAAKEGRVDELLSEMGKRVANLSERGRQELDTRRAVNALAARQFEAETERGQVARIAAAHNATLAAENPLAAATANNLGFSAVNEGIMASKVSMAIEKQTRDLRKPAIAPAAQ